MIGSIIAKSRISKMMDALNERDIETFMSTWHGDGEFIFPGDLTVSGTTKGKQAIKDWFLNFFQQFPSFHFTLNSVCVNRLFDITGTNTATAQWNAELTNKSGEKFQNIGVNLIKIHRGLETELRVFIFNPENLKNQWEEI